MKTKQREQWRERAAQAITESQVQLYAVQKGDFYYRPNAAGYTAQLSQAGRYTEEEGRRELVSGEPMRLVPIPRFPDGVTEPCVLIPARLLLELLATDEAMQERAYRKALDTVLAAAYAQANGHEHCREINAAIATVMESRKPLPPATPGASSPTGKVTDEEARPCATAGPGEPTFAQ